ncbi:hypothetical protein HMPREF9141_0879 [Prevotella multiformis DSM 16608]|uniref:Uncharacterized protein n=1 Tax=Prevotella multiformis DSM 16608 TaxID=888743 RepID=F0F5L3_9BACT|nr:hypothetical protein HMPREF9141_0879 [Prevotella multiformis DSM 16608]
MMGDGGVPAMRPDPESVCGRRLQLWRVMGWQPAIKVLTDVPE